jgi:hypothetical protein
MKEIPSEVMTAILPDLPLNFENDLLPIGFQNRRKANKSTLYNKIYSSIPRNDDYSPKASPEYITLKNTGFTLELEEIEDDPNRIPRVIVSHPDLPERTHYKFGFHLDKDNWWKMVSLIALSGGIIRRKLVGTFYYDPESKFFVLENDPVGEMKDSKDLGSKLSGKWTKVVPGHEYYLELGPGRLKVMRAVYLGLIHDIPLYNPYCYRRTYLTMYPKEFKFGDGYYYGTIQREDAMLFRMIEPEETYFLTTKSGLRGIDLGDRGETMDLLGYQDLCLENSWVIGMDLKNKDIFKKYIIEPLIEFIKAKSGCLDDYRFTGDYRNSVIDLRVYSSRSLYSKIKEKLGTLTPWQIAGKDMIGLCAMFNKDFVDLSEEEIKDALHEIFMGCFGRD